MKQLNIGYPSREEAERLLAESVPLNPGPWGDHSRVVALAAERIAKACGMDSEKAYVLGLLHDIGRRCGKGHLLHVYGGYRYMMELGYPDVAKICITHSYNNQNPEEDVCSEEPDSEMFAAVSALVFQYEYDDYDLLIQLCDSIGMAEGVVPIEVRMSDVKRRYGRYPQPKWDKNLELKAYFSEKCGAPVETVASGGAPLLYEKP